MNVNGSFRLPFFVDQEQHRNAVVLHEGQRIDGERIGFNGSRRRRHDLLNTLIKQRARQAAAKIAIGYHADQKILFIHDSDSAKPSFGHGEHGFPHALTDACAWDGMISRLGDIADGAQLTAQLTAGMETPEVIAGKTPRFEHSHGERIAQGIHSTTIVLAEK